MSNSKLILVVDDDEDSRSMVRTILEANGFDVHECSGGNEAIQRLSRCSGDTTLSAGEKLEDATPALVLLDIMMPEVSGYDVVVQMKQKPNTQNIPIIMVSAKGDPEDLIAGYKDYGVEYYITKPFTTRQLLAGIKLVLG